MDNLDFKLVPMPGTRSFAEVVQFCDRHRPLVLAQLPWIAGELAHEVGFAPMLRIVYDKGGTRLHFSSREILSRQFQLEISQHFYCRILSLNNGTSFIELPSAWGVFGCLRRTAILVDLVRGTPQSTIAREYGVTMRYVRKLKRLERLDTLHEGTVPS